MARNNRTHASLEHNSRYELYSTVCGCFLCHLFRWRYNFILSLHIHAILHLIIIFFNMSLEHVASQSLSFFHAHVSSNFISRARYSTNGRVNKWEKMRNKRTACVYVELSPSKKLTAPVNFPCKKMLQPSLCTRGKLSVFRSFSSNC